ncbi:MAG: phosphotransferase [Candidatus Cloacimonetes bacterium]|nr:phosphotransferase [Candidatus Cloacimonadota bacterium]
MKNEIIINKNKRQVIKICNTPKMFKKELYIYKYHLPYTPRLIDNDGKNTLILEYIDGIPIFDMAEPDFVKITKLIMHFHSIEPQGNKCICHYDNNPRNFLFSNGKYYILDFSEWIYDYPETDLIHFLLFCASEYNLSKFRKVFKQVTETYRSARMINPLEWELLIPEVIFRFDSRRKKFHKYKDNPDLSENRDFLKNIL